MLGKLDAMQIVHYRPQPKGPQIYFVSERIDEHLIQPAVESYDRLKEVARKRLDAVKAYVQSDSPCRSRQLVAYFGEVVSSDCGLCDVCLRAERKPQELVAAIEKLLEKNAMGVTQLCDALQDEGFENADEMLREMLDRGLLSLDRDAFLHLNR